MTEFRVWAPNAEQVELVLGDERRAERAERHAMARGERGWWTVELPFDARGRDYAYALDGSDPLPDPRSPWQPHGVHGFSRVVSHADFEWHDAGFQAPPLASGVIYELHVGTFTPEGTFDSAIARLDHVRALGATHVEIMPVAAFPGSHGWGYDGVDLYAPYEPYGGPAAMKRFVDACHARGLAVLLDVVYNHFGPAGNYVERFGPYFTDAYRTPWGRAVNYDDAGSDEVRRFVIDNALMWLRDYHVDGLRLDAVHAIHDESARHVLEEMAEEVHALGARLGRHLVLIAESDLNDPRLLRAREAGGYGLDAQWSDDFHHALHAVLTGEQHGYYADFGPLADLARAVERAYVYDGRYSPHRGRRHGRAADGLDGERFVVFAQNHDQVGNRAAGERLAHLVSEGRARIAAALVLASPYVPLLFQGEEWGATAPFQYFTAHEEKELADAVREGRRKEFAAFGWGDDVPDPQAKETFLRSKLDWSELEREPHASLLAWHRELIRLRRSVPDLADPRRARTSARFDEEARWFVLARGDVVIACNLAQARQRVPLPAGPARVVLLASDGTQVDGASVTLEPDGVAVLAPAR
ncbi:MAG TPA: malto-oligosyltrehalose trehalohydrolase [Candidatus Binatia bacterium]